jgi:glycosyltransferase involved in cell wall biosynthesis
MRLTLFSEYRCALDGNGAVCSQYGPFWQRYLDVFSGVRVAACLTRHTISGVPLTTRGVSFVPLPSYSGPAQYVQALPALTRAVRDACADDSAYIVRVPHRLGVLAASALRRTGKPYCIEVIGDPHDAFAPGGVHHPLRPFLRWKLTADLRNVARDAAAALYVTESALQQRYPCPSLMIGVSDVDLTAGALSDTWKRPDRQQTSFRIVTVGSLAQLYKGQDVLLAAIAQCVRRGLDVTLVFVGDGRYRSQLEALAAQLGIGARTTFRGQLPPGAAVRAELDSADLFILPSRAEGLPRALVEAMARGLPCLASRIGGVPELIAEEDLLTPGDVRSTAAQIESVLRQPERRARMAERNLRRARDFQEEQLIGRRRRFYQEVLAATKRS